MAGYLEIFLFTQHLLSVKKNSNNTDIVELQVEIPFIAPLPSPTKGPKKTTGCFLNKTLTGC